MGWGDVEREEGGEGVAVGACGGCARVNKRWEKENLDINVQFCGVHPLAPGISSHSFGTLSPGFAVRG